MLWLQQGRDDLSLFYECWSLGWTDRGVSLAHSLYIPGWCFWMTWFPDQTFLPESPALQETNTETASPFRGKLGPDIVLSHASHCLTHSHARFRGKRDWFHHPTGKDQRICGYLLFIYFCGTGNWIRAFSLRYIASLLGVAGSHYS